MRLLRYVWYNGTSFGYGGSILCEPEQKRAPNDYGNPPQRTSCMHCILYRLQDLGGSSSLVGTYASTEAATCGAVCRLRLRSWEYLGLLHTIFTLLYKIIPSGKAYQIAGPLHATVSSPSLWCSHWRFFSKGPMEIWIVMVELWRSVLPWSHCDSQIKLSHKPFRPKKKRTLGAVKIAFPRRIWWRPNNCKHVCRVYY